MLALEAQECKVRSGFQTGLALMVARMPPCFLMLKNTPHRDEDKTPETPDMATYFRAWEGT